MAPPKRETLCFLICFFASFKVFLCFSLKPSPNSASNVLWWRCGLPQVVPLQMPWPWGLSERITGQPVESYHHWTHWTQISHWELCQVCDVKFLQFFPANNRLYLQLLQFFTDSFSSHSSPLLKTCCDACCTIRHGHATVAALFDWQIDEVSMLLELFCLVRGSSMGGWAPKYSFCGMFLQRTMLLMFRDMLPNRSQGTNSRLHRSPNLWNLWHINDRWF